MGWVLMGFHKQSEQLEFEMDLPDSIDDNVIRSLVGDHPNLHVASFPLKSRSLKRLKEEFGLNICENELDYFIEYCQ